MLNTLAEGSSALDWIFKDIQNMPVEIIDMVMKEWLKPHPGRQHICMVYECTIDKGFVKMTGAVSLTLEAEYRAEYVPDRDVGPSVFDGE
jgi:uncharacterized phage protein gp47/JayE